MRIKLLFFLGWAATASFGAPLTVISYDMLNGATGSYNYRDFSYLPCPGGNCDSTGAALSGGVGKLTDGVLPSTSWNQQAFQTSWVGWDTAQDLANPVITFHFGGLVNIDAISIWADNTLNTGGVALPGAVVINGTTYAIADDLVNPDPRALTFSGLNLTGSSVTIEFQQRSGASWLMIGEVSFEGAPVPEPSAWLLASAGLGLMAGLARRRQSRRCDSPGATPAER